MKYPNLVCLLTGGPLYRIYVENVWICFEWHHYCGPMPLHKKTLEPRELGPRHKFWSAVTLWCNQGKETGGQFGEFLSCAWKDGPLVRYV